MSSLIRRFVSSSLAVLALAILAPLAASAGEFEKCKAQCRADKPAGTPARRLCIAFCKEKWKSGEKVVEPGDDTSDEPVKVAPK